MWSHEVAKSLRRIARDQEIKAYVLENPPLYRACLRAASRFIGGENLSQCIAVVRASNKQGFAASMDYMGESTQSLAMAQHATDEFGRIVDAIGEHHLDCSVSLDLSHLGLTIDPDTAFKNVSALARAAAEVQSEVMINAEGSERTDAILELHRRLCARHENVGITMQAYLYRSEADLESLLTRPGRIRLVKGAYEEQPAVARQRGEAVDNAFREFSSALLASGNHCSIATHDPVLLDQAHKFIRQRRLRCETIEFEMLYGIAVERLEEMRNKGYRSRIYIPYGREWYLYLCHRLAEHPPNIYKAIIDAASTKLFPKSGARNE